MIILEQSFAAAVQIYIFHQILKADPKRQIIGRKCYIRKQNPLYILSADGIGSGWCLTIFECLHLISEQFDSN